MPLGITQKTHNIKYSKEGKQKNFCIFQFMKTKKKLSNRGFLMINEEDGIAFPKLL